MMQPTLVEYEEAERNLAAIEAGRGLLIHSIVTVVVAAALIVINVFVAPQFPWSPFPVVGMGLGVLVHYLFGVRWQGRFLRKHQEAVEHRAAELTLAG